MREIERARAIDPLSMIINTRAGTFLFFAKHYDSARVQLLHTLELDPENPLAHMQLSRAYLGAPPLPGGAGRGGEGGDGRRELRGGEPRLRRGDLRRQRARAARAAAAASPWRRRQYVPADVIARLYAGLGERGQGAAIGSTGPTQQDTWSLILLKVEPMYDNLRGEPRFQA